MEQELNIHHAAYTLDNLSDVNFVLGKNGCGKSTMLRNLTNVPTAKDGPLNRIHYVNPERGGSVTYQSHVADQLSHNANWAISERQSNENSSFRSQSIAFFGKYELQFLREYERRNENGEDTNGSFDQFISKLSDLTQNIELVRDERSIVRYKRKGENGGPVGADSLSSGEKEVISLGMECMVFAHSLKVDETGLLLLDEPDVHMHPDQQERFVRFLFSLCDNKKLIVIIVTHSTSMLASSRLHQNVRVSFMHQNQTQFRFWDVDESLKKLVPVFGAHPLSRLFNESPLLLIEGEDDERVWQTAIRTSSGRIKLYPCVCGDKDRMREYEAHAIEILTSLYDDAVAFSLRDRDDSEEDIQRRGPIIRMRLSCRTPENLILADETLANANTNWVELVPRIENWLQKNQQHQHFAEMNELKASGYDRKNGKLKAIRNDLLGIIGTNKSWELLVGQTIGKLSPSHFDTNIDHSLANYLGTMVIEKLLS